MTKRKRTTFVRGQNKRPSKGLTLPGYNNLGPFNEVNTPLTKSDADALMHDIKYDKIGKRAYWTFNQADQDLIENLKDETDIGSKIAKNVFEVKKKLSEWKFLPSDPIQSKVKENPLLDFHKGSGNHPLTRARKKALERQQRITDYMKKKKPNVKPSLLSNLQQSDQMSTQKGGEGSKLDQGLKETPVDQVIDVERGFPSYQFASLPWSGIMFMDSNRYTGLDIGFRMTSPYDVVIGGTVKDRNTNTGKSSDIEMKQDSDDVVVQSAMWFNWYASLYKYYHVVGCKWSIIFENLCNEPIWVHQMYLNDTTPPYFASNEDMLMWNDVESHYVEPMAKYVDENGVKAAQLNQGWQRETNSLTNGENFTSATAINSNRRNTLQLSGQYSPGDKSHDVRLDADVENWSLTNANPKLIERLLLRVKPETQAQRAEGDQGANSYGRKLKYKYTVKLEYLVEFKELVDGLRWPTCYTNILPTISQSGFTTEKQNENEPTP